MRTKEEILEEIKKVRQAKKQAERKIIRCDNRLTELNREFFIAESEEE